MQAVRTLKADPSRSNLTNGSKDAENGTSAADPLAVLNAIATRVVDVLDAGPSTLNPQIVVTVAVATPLLALLCCMCLCLLCRCAPLRSMAVESIKPPISSKMMGLP